MRALVLGDRQGNVSKGPVRPFEKIDIDALLLITDRAHMKPLQKSFSKKKLLRTYKRGMAYPENPPEEWQWRMTEARMMLGEFRDWNGWQWRNQWAKGLWMNHKGSWKGEQCERIWIFGEQGLGDEILFSQVLPDVRKHFHGDIVFECEPRMVSVLKRSMPEITAKAVGLERLANGKDVRKPDMDHSYPWLPVGDLVRNFRRYPVQFPRKTWLTPDPEKVEKYKHFRGRTAIVWRGAQGEFSWKDLHALYPDAISLQYDQRPDEKVERPPFDPRDDIEDIFGFLANVDRLVGPSNTAIHMAASIGTKVDVVLAPLMSGRRNNPLPFRYFGIRGSRKSIWYPDNLTRYENLQDYKAHKDEGPECAFGLTFDYS